MVRFQPGGRNAPVVQWIGRHRSKVSMRVRFLPGVQNFSKMEWYWYLIGGIWVVHKFKYYLPSGNILDEGESGIYNSYNEARFKSYKNAREQFPNENIELEDLEDENGKYFLVRVVIGIIQFIFMPIPKK